MNGLVSPPKGRGTEGMNSSQWSTLQGRGQKQAFVHLQLLCVMYLSCSRCWYEGKSDWMHLSVVKVNFRTHTRQPETHVHTHCVVLWVISSGAAYPEMLNVLRACRVLQLFSTYPCRVEHCTLFPLLVTFSEDTGHGSRPVS